MDVGHLLPTRPAYYDRNPVQNSALAGPLNLGTHGDTLWFLVTVPSGKLAVIDSAQVVANVISNPIAIGVMNASILYTGAGPVFANIVYVNGADATSNTNRSCNVGMAGSMMSGDSIGGHSSWTAATGTLLVTLSAKILQYDK